MKRSLWAMVPVLSIFLMLPGFVWAHGSYISLYAPYDGQTFVVDTLPLTVAVSGTIAHNAPPNGANVADSQACATVDAGTPGAVQVCQPAPTFQGKPPTSYNYNVNVVIDSVGAHTLQASTSKSDGGHPGQSELITIYVYLSSTSCDEVDPPAYANHYMNSFEPPQAFAKYRGGVIREIAHNHDNGVYGTCQYDYYAVKADVCAALIELGGPVCPE